MSNKEYLLSLIQIDDLEVQEMALDEMLNNIETDWIWYISNTGKILNLCSKNNQLSQKLNLLLSKIYFFGNDMDRSVEHALLAEDLFDSSQRDLYSDNVLTLIISRYIENVNKEDKEMNEDEFEKYKNIVEKMLNKSFNKLNCI